MSESLPSFRQRFLGRVCAFDYFLYILFVFQLVLLLLNTVSYLTVNLPPSTLSIVYLNFLLLGVLFVITGGTIYMCGTYQGDEKLITLPDRGE